MSDFNTKDRIPPFNEEAERATLGAILLGISREVLLEVLQAVRVQDFYRPAHGVIFAAISEMIDELIPIDLLTLKERLRGNDTLDRVGGASYLLELTSSVPTRANVLYYATQVRECSTRRQLISAAEEMKKRAHDGSTLARDVIEESEKSIFAINDQLHEGTFHPSSELVMETVRHIEMRHMAKALLSGVPSGFSRLDKITAGFQDSDMIIVGARPSMGKTALALSLISHIAGRKKIPTGLFTLEMSSVALMTRMLASEAHVSSEKIRTGLTTEHDMSMIVEAAGRIHDAPLYVEDTPNLGLVSIRAEARRMVALHDVRILFIDYLGLIASENKNAPRHEQVADISKSIKALARELNVPIIALSQVGRQTEGKAPGLADLRESGALEQDADVVIFLHRERMYEDERPPETIETDLIVAKQRNGPVGCVKLIFLPRYARFETPERRKT